MRLEDRKEQRIGALRRADRWKVAGALVFAAISTGTINGQPALEVLSDPKTAVEVAGEAYMGAVEAVMVPAARVVGMGVCKTAEVVLPFVDCGD